MNPLIKHSATDLSTLFSNADFIQNEWQVFGSSCPQAPRHKGVQNDLKKISTHSLPRFYIDVSSQLHAPAALPRGIEARYPLGGPQSLFIALSVIEPQLSCPRWQSLPWLSYHRQQFVEWKYLVRFVSCVQVACQWKFRSRGFAMRWSKPAYLLP